MRLTLRTLLAYLDDTLDREQTRQIGQKVAESDVARELIQRIRKVTRRRSLGVPPTSGPDKADANTVAEYLDNDLAVDKVGEVEDKALHSEVHLAEIAACHQLLTLILSEPAKVPPTARQRMYGLVKGPEADPTRRAPRVAAATMAVADSLSDDGDGHPLVSRQGGAKRLAIAGGLAVLLGLTTWAALSRRDAPPAGPPLPPMVRNDRPAADAAPPADAPRPEEAAKAPEPPANEPVAKTNDPPALPPPPMPMPLPEPAEPPAGPAAVAMDLQAARRTSADRRIVGRPEFGGPPPTHVLLQLADDIGNWRRVGPADQIQGTTRLMALPTQGARVRLDYTVEVDLWGPTPDALFPRPIVAFGETVVAVFVPPDGFDAALRVERGRVYVRALKPAGAKVRVHAGEQVFDVTLPDAQAEVVAEVVSGPEAAGFIGAVRGRAVVRVNLQSEWALAAPPEAGLLTWTAADGPAGAPVALPESRWTRQPVQRGIGRLPDGDAFVRQVTQKLGNLINDLPLAVSEVGQLRPAGRTVMLFQRAALDDSKALLDTLEDPDATDRAAAAAALGLWFARDPALEARLTNEWRQRGFIAPQSASALAALRGLAGADPRDAKSFDAFFQGLQNDRLTTRELSAWRLGQYDPDGGRISGYQPADSGDKQAAAVRRWKLRFNEGMPKRS